MEKFTIHKGRLVPLLNDNIDTDQLIPKKFLKRVEKTGYGDFLFDEWRYLDNGEKNPDFPLNDPKHKGATILVSGDNFGSGSSREHAAWALRDFGFKTIIAGSFSDIFYMNALKNGLLPIRLNLAEREEIAKISSDKNIEIDLIHQQVKTEKATYAFDIDTTWKNKLINGLDDIDITLGSLEQIEQYEQKRPSYLQKMGQ